MIQWLKELDEVLRGHKGDARLLAGGMVHIQIKPLVVVSIVLGVVCGVFMGLYAVLTRTPPCFARMFASAVKVPILFILTLVITFPSLYVFSTLLGVRLGPKDTLRLILAPVSANLAVLASLGPITGFFTLSTSSYPFMKLLNFLFFALSGIIGLKVLLTMPARLDAAQGGPAIVVQDPARNGQAAELSSLDVPAKPLISVRSGDLAGTTFRVWLVIYGLVGAQMGWVLRPFIGAPGSGPYDRRVIWCLMRTFGPGCRRLRAWQGHLRGRCAPEGSLGLAVGPPACLRSVLRRSDGDV